MVEPFSHSYYMTELDATPYSGDYAAIGTDLFTHYQTHHANTLPLVFRIKNRHIPTYSESNIPPLTLAIPFDLADELNVTENNDSSVLLTKKRAVETMVETYVL